MSLPIANLLWRKCNNILTKVFMYRDGLLLRRRHVSQNSQTKVTGNIISVTSNNYLVGPDGIINELRA